MSTESYSGWAILELLGHRQRPGFVREVELCGAKMLRVDVPAPDGDVTEYYAAAALYCLRPVSEEIARDAARGAVARPIRPMAYATHSLADMREDDDA